MKYVLWLMLATACVQQPDPQKSILVDKISIAQNGGNPQNDSLITLQRTRDRETFQALPYPCPGTGRPLVGYGVEISETAALKIRSRGGITPQEADSLMLSHYAKLNVCLAKLYPPLPDHQRWACLSAAYGMGIGSFNRQLGALVRSRRTGPQMEKRWAATAVRWKNNIASRQAEAATYSK